MAAPTRVQSTGRIRSSGTGQVLLPLPSPPSVGNTIVTAAILFSTNLSPLTCSDNRGNTYTQAVVQHNGNLHLVVFVCTVLTTGSPFTATINDVPNANAQYEAMALEVTGAVTIDQTITQNGTGTTVSTGNTAALTGTDVFVLALHAIGANQASITVQSVSPTWFEEFENLSYSATVAGEIDSRSLTGIAGTAQSCSWTDITSSNYAAALVAFKTAPSASVRVSQDVVEIISLPFPEARVSQHVIEIISTTVSTAPPFTEKVQFILLG